MIRPYFVDKEALSAGDSLPLEQFIDQLAFNSQGLIPVITQEQETAEVLMMAWMNKAALLETLETRQMTYWSRSRNALWKKGLSSGHYQQLQSMRFDCDGDAILCQVTQTGSACHTGRKHCFYFQVNDDQQTVSITSSIPE